MYQRFNQENNISNFIKALLAQTNIPMIPFSKEDIEGHYIKNKYIYYSGKLIEPYMFGKEYPGLTTKYISNTSYYDGETHYYLGELLRGIRNYYEIDLMPFYNCFNNTFVKDVYLSKKTEDETGDLEVVSSTPYQLILIPIKFGKTYTIGLDCPSNFCIRPIFYGNKGLASTSDLASFSKDLSETKVISNGFFTKPFTYEMPSNEKYLPFEKFLKLAIQLPQNLKHSLVVLEGDYTLKGISNATIITNDEIKNEISENLDLNNLLISKLSLLQIPTNYPIAFNDRLIEYLLNNTITKDDPISDNIERVQSYISSNTNKVKNGSSLSSSLYTKGIWNDTMRVYLFNLMLNAKLNRAKVDLNGYVDKDTETIITKGQNV